MKNFYLFVSSLFLFFPCILARLQVSPLLVACGSATEKYLFSNCTTRVFMAPACLCNSLPWLGSLATCINEYAPNNRQEQNYAWSQINYYCRGEDTSFLAYQLPFQDIVANASNYMVPAPLDGKNTNLNNPIRFNDSLIYPVIRTVNEFNNQLQYGLVYGGAGCAFALGVMFLGMLNNLYHYYYQQSGPLISKEKNKNHHHHHHHQNKKKPKAIPPSPSWIQSLRRHLINPSLLFDGVHLEHTSWFGVIVTYPSRWESIFIFFYVMLNIVLLFPCYDLFVENTYWPGDTTLQLVRYVADRSGEMSFAQLPLVYLFGGRNNIMIYLTGWSYDRFIVAHKWTSRVMFLHAVVHSVAYTYFPYRVGGWATYYSYYQETYFVWGVVATVIGGFILLFALPSIRRACYDLFLYAHIAMVVIFTAGCWYHVNLLGDQENMAWVFIAMAIWAYDRIARFVRVVYYNVMLVTGYKMVRKVRADIIPGTDCIRFIVDANKSGLSRRKPGVFVYIYVPSVYFWQSHPFTIASWHQPSIDFPNANPNTVYGSTTTTINPSSTPKTMKKKTKTKSILPASSSSSSISSDQLSETDVPLSTNNNNNTYELLIRPQQGMTKKLYEKIEKEGPDGCDMYVLIEGPYGHTHPILQYDTAILIAGGVGTTATVPYLQEAVYNSSNMAVRHLVFIWVVQYEDQLKWSQDAIEECVSHINNNNHQHHQHHQQQQNQLESNNNGNEVDIVDIKSEASSLALDVSIYVTRSAAPLDNDDNKKNKLQGSSISYGVRPDLNKQVGQYIEMASGNSVAVLHCGPVRMSDQIRQITADYGIPYFEEAFNW